MYLSLMRKLNNTALRVAAEIPKDMFFRVKAENPDIYQAIDAIDNLNIFKSILAALNIREILYTQSNVTVFAPDDRSFDEWSPNPVDLFIKNGGGNVSVFDHIANGRLTLVKLKNLTGERIQALSGNQFTVRVQKTDGSIQYGSSMIVKPNIKCKNGLLHVVSGLAT